MCDIADKLDDSFTKFKLIIANNDPEDAIIKISKLKNPANNKKIGIDKAFSLYKININYSVKYDKNLYANNVLLWNKKILRNLKLAEEVYQNMK